MRRVEDPRVEKRVRAGGESTVTTHPSYAEIELSRVTGPAACYGSDLVHNGYIEITVRRSEMHRQDDREWAQPREAVFAARLTDAQFASLVAGVNSGAGVCCTMTDLGGAPIPDLPRRDSLIPFRFAAEGAVKDAIARVRRLGQKVNEIASSLSKADAETLLVEARRAENDLVERLPFIMSSAARHLDERTERAKVEIATYATSTMQRLGMDALKATQENVRRAMDRAP